VVKTRDVVVILILAIFASGCLSTSGDTGGETDIVGSEITCTPPYIVAGSSCCLDENSNKICDVDEEDAPATPAPTTRAPITAPPTTRAPATQPPQTTAAPATLPPTTQPPTTLAKATTTSTTSTTTSSTTTLPATPPPPKLSKTDNLRQYMGDISGYTTDGRGPYDLCLDICDWAEKYTKQPIEPGKSKSVKVEFYIQPSSAAAVVWAQETHFANQSADSKNWKLTTFKGYSANKKVLTDIVISDSKESQVFLRVAVGNVGIQAQLTQRVSKYGELTPIEELEAIVDEVTGAVISKLG